MREHVQHSEPQAVRLLRAIVTGTTRQREVALLQAGRLLNAVRQPQREAPNGRPMRIFTFTTLREAARRRAGGEPIAEIARSMSVDYTALRHHFRPSKAMLAACAQTP